MMSSTRPTPPRVASLNKGGDTNNVVTGKGLVRAMILLGMASLVINFRYYYMSINVNSQSSSTDPDDIGTTAQQVSEVAAAGGSAAGGSSSSAAVAAENEAGDQRSIFGGFLQALQNRKRGHKVKKTFDGEFKGGQLVKRDRKGRTIVKQITALNQNDLGDLGGDDAVAGEGELTLEEAMKGREPIIQALREAGIQEFDAATVAKLPTWEQVEKLYGKGPVVYGLETCDKFKKSVPPQDWSMASAGIFNSGTNTFAMYMNANCYIPQNKKEKYGGMRWQVPWGKHMVAKRKWTNTVKNDERVNKTAVLPVVAIRDPYTWMQSMCRHPYATKWHHGKRHCPNLVPNEDDLDLFPYLEDNVPVYIKYPGQAEHWDSLVHLYNSWYRQYFDADYPRLFIRFEDLLFNVKEMVRIVCDCVGGVPRQEEFAYVVDSGKFGPGHPEQKGTQHTNLIGAMVKYGTDKLRFTGMTEDDLRYAYEHLDTELMMTFQYEIPPPPP